jgi:hypothetical protein
LWTGAHFDRTTNPIAMAAMQSGVNASPRLASLPRVDAEFDDLDDHKVQQLLALTFNALKARRIPIPRPMSSTVTKPDVYNNARFEQIACAGLTQKYRWHNEVWEPATYFLHEGKTVDLIQHFTKVLLSTIQQHVATRWNSPDSRTQHHIRGMPFYNSRLFGLFLINSLTPAFAALLYSRIDSRYSLDGQLLFLTLCTDIHHNRLAFVESVKNKIWSSALTDHKNNVATYL